ncbi:hypothetical protein J6590_093804 [Homalodisca vitripennis]|nr:hypothetical protein J6590_069337 [Homalodisca vitripennis]KAG8314380.1 hypothetical protein J6590_093804 [Homalodisca vitripennis]
MANKWGPTSEPLGTPDGSSKTVGIWQAMRGIRGRLVRWLRNQLNRVNSSKVIYEQQQAVHLANYNPPLGETSSSSSGRRIMLPLFMLLLFDEMVLPTLRFNIILLLFALHNSQPRRTNLRRICI